MVDGYSVRGSTVDACEASPTGPAASIEALPALQDKKTSYRGLSAIRYAQPMVTFVAGEG
ncbi:MAG: hypothetical protein V7642_4205 [Burkholderiales bacterium]|jgi:hypothetical protein